MKNAFFGIFTIRSERPSPFGSSSEIEESEVLFIVSSLRSSLYFSISNVIFDSYFYFYAYLSLIVMGLVF